MAGPGKLDWYNPETGRVEEIDDPDYHASPYEVAHNDGRGDEFDAATKWFYEQYPNGVPPDGSHDADTNWYQPNTWRSDFGPSPTPGIDPPPTGGPGPAPLPPGGTPTSPTGGGGNGSSFGGWPTFTAPRFTAPPPFSYPEFSYESYALPEKFTYDAFAAPTMADAENEPGYAFAKEQGIKALENSKAAQGVLRTGGSLKDILGWGNRFGEQNYGNVYNRSANTYTLNRGNAFENWGANEAARASAYDRNRGNAFGSWEANRNNAASNYQTNYGVSRDVFDRNYQGALDEFNPTFRTAELTFADAYNRWRDELDALTRIGTAGAI